MFWRGRDGDIILTIHFNMDNVKTTTGQPWYYNIAEVKTIHGDYWRLLERTLESLVLISCEYDL